MLFLSCFIALIRRKVFAIQLTILTLIIAPVSCLLAGNGGTNVASLSGNNGFENSLTTWSFSTPAAYTVNSSATYYRSGTKSLKLTTTSATDLKAYPSGNTITVGAGVGYLTVIAWVKSSTTNASVAVGIYNTSTSTETASGTRVTPTTSGWTSVSTTFAVTSGDTYYPILYGKSANGVSATMYFDDMVFYSSNTSTTDLTVAVKGTHPTATISGTDVTLNWDAGSDAETGVDGYLILRNTGLQTATNINPLSQCNYSSTSSTVGPIAISTWTVVYNDSVTSSFTDSPGASGVYTYLIYTRDKAYNYMTGANSVRMFVFNGTGLAATLAASANIDGLYLPANDTITIASAATATIRAGAEIRIEGNIIEQGNVTNSAGGTVEFKNGSMYRFNRNGSSTAIISPATWSPGSLCLIDGITTTAPSGLNQTFNNLTWNCSGQTVNVTFPASAFQVNGDFIIQNTGTKKITLRASTFNGNVWMTGGTVDCTSGTTITLSGTERQIFGITGPAYTINLNNNANAILAQNLTVNTNLILTYGTLYDSTFTLTMANLAKITKLDGNLDAAPTFSGSVDLTYNISTSTGNEVPSGTVRNMVVNASGGTITLNSPVTMTGALTLTSGVVQTSSTNFITMNAGSSTSGASNTSYIDGPIKKIGNTAFTFPIGDNGNYQPLAITAPSVATDAFTAYYMAANPSALYDTSLKAVSIDHVSLAEYWDLSRDAGTSNVKITLTFDNLSGGITNLSDLVVAHWSGGQWQNEGLFASTGTTSAGTIQSNTVTSYSPFTLASINRGSNPLPVNLLSFDGVCEDKKVVLNWKTASEFNNDYFDVERSSDADSYQSLVRIKGSGNSTTIQNYQYEDMEPLKSPGYYRLKQTDYNGHSSYFGPVFMNCNDAETVAPEVFYGEESQLVIFHHQAEMKCTLTMYDLTGRIVLSKVIVLLPGRNEIDVNGSADGACCRILTLSDENSSLKFSKLIAPFKH